MTEWAELALPLALSNCEMTHEEFRQLTPREIAERMKASEQQHKYRCWFLSHLMNSAGTMKEPVTVEKLLGVIPKTGKKMTLKSLIEGK